MEGSSEDQFGQQLKNAHKIPVFRRHKFDAHTPTNYCMPYNGRGVDVAVRQFEGQSYDRSHWRQDFGWDKNASRT
jgi:hypothetical protein